MVNKNIFFLGLVSFFTDFASSMVTSILPIYVVYILNEDVEKLGYILAITSFISYAFRFVFGYLSDKFQIVKPFVVTGYFLSAITKPLLYFATSWQGIATLRGVERIGKAIRSASKDSLISSYAKNQSGKSFGFHKAMDVAGEMSGAIVSFLVLFYIGKNIEVFKSIFAFSLIPGIIAVIIVIFFVKDTPYKQKKDINFDLSSDYKLLPVLFIYFFAIFFIFSDSFFIIKAKESGYNIEYLPLFIVFLYFVQTSFSYFFGLKIDKFGSNKILLISFIFGLISLIFLYFNYIILSFLFLGIFIVSSLNAIRVYISKNAINKSSVFGFFYSGVAIFNAIGSVVVGIIWNSFGENFAIIFSIIGIFIIIFISFKGLNRYENFNS